MALAVKDVGLKVGSLFIGKGLTRAMDYVDATYAAGQPLEKRPGTWVNTLGGLAAILLSYFMLKKNPTAQEVGVLVGGKMLTRSTDYLEEAMAPSAGVIAGAAFVPAGPQFVPATEVAPATNIAIKPPVAQGKYRVT